jgi:hypothetical protein
MRTCHFLAGVVLWLFTPVAAVDAGDAPKEVTVTPYDSTTNGALRVKAVSAEPADWFMVYQNGKQLVPPGKPRLNSTVELAPGTYAVRVNKTERTVTVEAGKTTTLLAGELVVQAKEGTPGWYTPFQGKEARLATNPPVLNRPIALFAGKYTVQYKEGGVSPPQDLGEAEVKAGRTTVLKR